MKKNDKIFKFLVHFMTIVTILIVIFIIGYIGINGIKGINLEFLKSIVPMIATTLITIFVTVIIGTPIAVFSAIYLNEYAKGGKIVSLIRFSIDTLVGVPSIVYGIFGMLVFGRMLSLGFSIISGCLTLSIIILPVIIKVTEEALKTVPISYREASYGLGVGKFRTIIKVILPSSYKGILNGIILAIGRIVGESAAVLYTIGSVPYMPKSIFSSGETLSVYMYMLTKEGLADGVNTAFATAFILILIVIIINTTATKLSKSVQKG